MKNYTIYLLMLVCLSIGITSCEKTESEFVPDLVGTWFCEDFGLQYSIINTKGTGDLWSFLEINNSEGRFLKLKINSETNPSETLYKVISVSKTELLLQDTSDNKVYTFLKIGA